MCISYSHHHHEFFSSWTNGKEEKYHSEPSGERETPFTLLYFFNPQPTKTALRLLYNPFFSPLYLIAPPLAFSFFLFFFYCANNESTVFCVSVAPHVLPLSLRTFRYRTIVDAMQQQQLVTLFANSLHFFFSSLFFFSFF